MSKLNDAYVEKFLADQKKAFTEPRPYTSWRCDNIFKWTAKEVVRPRTFPFLLFGILQYPVWVWGFGTTPEERKASVCYTWGVGEHH